MLAGKSERPWRACSGERPRERTTATARGQRSGPSRALFCRPTRPITTKTSTWYSHFLVCHRSSEASSRTLLSRRTPRPIQCPTRTRTLSRSRASPSSPASSTRRSTEERTGGRASSDSAPTAAAGDRRSQRSAGTTSRGQTHGPAGWTRSADERPTTRTTAVSMSSPSQSWGSRGRRSWTESSTGGLQGGSRREGCLTSGKRARVGPGGTTAGRDATRMRAGGRQ